MRLGATRALFLNRWTRHRPIRAEHAAVTGFGLEATAAPRAVIEELAGVGGHRLGGLMPASRARDCGREHDHHIRRKRVDDAALGNGVVAAVAAA